jgi:hypothetical protein
MSIREKIEMRFSALEEQLNSGKHLEDPESVTDLISSISKFTSILSSAERDFVNAAKMAVEEKKQWS